MTPETRSIGCEEALRLLAEYLDGELHDARGNEVRAHMERCRSCYSRVEFERRLKQALVDLRHSDVEPQLELRIRNLLRDFRAADGAAG